MPSGPAGTCLGPSGTSKSQGQYLYDASFSLASRTSLHSLAALALAGLAAARALVVDFDHGAIIDLFEGDFKCLLGGFDLGHLASAALPATAASEKHVHDITAIGLRALAAVLIVNPAFFRIGKGLICFRNFFELSERGLTLLESPPLRSG